VRTSLGLQGSLILLTIVGSVALTFVVGKPRLVWSLLLAAVCGLSIGRVEAGWYAMFGTGEGLLLIVAPVVLLGVGFAWRPSGWHATAAGWLGAVYVAAEWVGALWDCWTTDCDEPAIAAVFVFMPMGAVIAGGSAVLTVTLRNLLRRFRRRSRNGE
jgi:hypothetical protein